MSDFVRPKISQWDLISAAETGDIASVQKLLQSGADVNRKDADGRTPLHWAAENGHVEIVNTLLFKGADVHATTKYRYTPLHYAAMNGHVEIVNTLLAKGADVHAKGTFLWTPLHWAAEKGHVRIVNSLLANEADVHATDPDGYTPLHYAAANDHLEIVNTLLVKGADVHAKGTFGWTPLHWAAEKGHVQIVNTLLAQGADVHGKGINGWTPLHWAASNGHVEVVNTLLVKGADIHGKGTNGRTALNIATRKRYLKVVECLNNAMQSIHQRIDALNTAALESVLTNNTTDMENIENGNTPLLHAAERGFYEGVEILLHHKANIFATQEHTLCTVLHLAVLKGDIPTMQLVLECGQESLINLQDKDGNTALHVAIGLGREDSVHTLLFFYPDMSVRNHQGESVLECAVKLHVWNIFVMLCQHEGTKWNDVRSHCEEESWLVMAYRDRHGGALKWLLEHGGGGDWHDIDTQSGLSILHLVCQELCDHDDLIATCFSPAALMSSSTESLDPKVLHLQVFFQRFRQAPWLLLHYGAEHGKKEVLETVLEACSSADAGLINRQDETKNANTAMHLAVKGGHMDCVRSLLYFYPDLTVVNKDGETALYTAAKQQEWEAVHVLLQHAGGPSLELHAHYPKTAGARADSLLKLAVQHKKTEVIRLLIEKAGAEVKEMDNKSGLRVLLKLLEEVIPAKEEEVVVQICDWLCALIEANPMLSYEFKQFGCRRVIGWTISAYYYNDRICDVLAKILFLMSSA